MINGTYRLLDAEDEQVYAYLREGNGSSAGQTLLVIANFTDQQIERSYVQPDGEQTLLTSNYTDDEGETLRPYEAKVYLHTQKEEN